MCGCGGRHGADIASLRLALLVFVPGGFCGSWRRSCWQPNGCHRYQARRRLLDGAESRDMAAVALRNLARLLPAGSEIDWTKEN